MVYPSSFQFCSFWYVLQKNATHSFMTVEWASGACLLFLEVSKYVVHVLWTSVSHFSSDTEDAPLTFEMEVKWKLYHLFSHFVSDSLKYVTFNLPKYSVDCLLGFFCLVFFLIWSTPL